MTKNELDNLLEVRLARLEAGESLDACLEGLPESEAGLLQKAAQLRALPRAVPNADRKAAQRRELLRLAKENRAQVTHQSSQVTPSVRARWALPALALAGVAALFVCVFVISALAGMAWLWRRTQPPAVAQNPSVTASVNPTAIALDPANPQSGVLREVVGLVEVQAPDGTWQAVAAGHVVKAGQRIRTGVLSRTILAFYDGGQTSVGPNSEITIDALDAQKSGPRVVALTQWVGESDHDVAASNDAGSRYEVATPSGTGTAKGTAFHVLVTSLIVRFDVDEGEVAVTNLDVTVIVVAGQSTTVNVGETPDDPVFRVTGEGALETMGDTWRIAGQSFLIDDNTVILGDPQIGDWVRVEGRLLPNGTRVADLIILLHRSLENRFVFTGLVEAIEDTRWSVAGRLVRVDELTGIDDGLAVGDLVEVQGGVAPDGAFWASSIQRVVTNGFRFTGVVQSLSAEIWAVSGISVTVNISTTIEPGIVVGDRVLVAGEIQGDGTWLATSIQRATTGMFDFMGVVIRTDPWVVSGIAIETDEFTAIDEGIEVGNRVRVRGRVLADGTWLADSIEQLDEGQRHHVKFTARVKSISPWIVGAVVVTVDDKTRIDDGIEVGDLVTVKGDLLSDGTVLAKEIRRAHGAKGCLNLYAIVQTVDVGQIVLLDGQTINLRQVPIKGELQVASVVIVLVCAQGDGSMLVVSIIVIFQLDALPPLPPPVEGCVGMQVVVVANGQITLPNGSFIQLDNHTWLKIESKGKGDKIEVKLNGKDPKIEIKVKAKGKHPEIEVKAKGKGKEGPILIGAGKYPLSSTLVLNVCTSQAVPVFIVNGQIELPPTPVPPPPPPPSADPIVITENNQTLTLTCNSNSVTINGNNNTITLLGACGNVTIRGNSNWVSIQSATSITNTGNDNIIQQR